MKDDAIGRLTSYRVYMWGDPKGRAKEVEKRNEKLGTYRIHG